MIKNKSVQLTTLIVISILIWGVITPERNGELTPELMGRIIGGGLAAVIFGLLITIPCSIYHKKKHGSWPHWQITHAAPLTFIFLYLAYSGSQRDVQSNLDYEINDNQLSQFVFTDDECDLSIVFPKKPTVKTIDSEQNLNIKEASIDLEDGSHLRAECSDFSGLIKNNNMRKDKDTWLGIMRVLFESDGMSTPVYSSEEKLFNNKNISIYRGRAYKTLSDVNVTYMVTVFVTDKSMMSVTVGGVSKYFPSKTVSNFISSVSLKN